MNILAVETSSKVASCALTTGSKLIGEIYSDTGLTHSQTIMPMVEKLLFMAGAKAADVDAFAVSVGPGSFTGLRIGISAVKGMAMGIGKTGCLCAPVSTLYGLALNVNIFMGYIVPVMDARRSQVYTALFAGGKDGMERLEADEAISMQELGKRLSTLDGPKLLVGDGAYLALESLKEIEGLCVAPPPLVYQRASSLCLAAKKIAEADGLIPARELVPAYLRLPQAERELREKSLK